MSAPHSQDDPLTPSKVTAHMLVLLIVVCGGCLIEAIRRHYEPPFFTNAMMGLGEVTLVIYFIGHLGRAFRWMFGEWFGNNSSPGTRRVRGQFRPTKMELADVIRQARDFIAIVVLILVGLAAAIILYDSFGGAGPPTTDNPHLAYLAYLKVGRLEFKFDRLALLLSPVTEYSFGLVKLCAIIFGATLVPLMGTALVKRLKN